MGRDVQLVFQGTVELLLAVDFTEVGLLGFECLEFMQLGFQQPLCEGLLQKIHPEQ